MQVSYKYFISKQVHILHNFHFCSFPRRIGVYSFVHRPPFKAFSIPIISDILGETSVYVGLQNWYILFMSLSSFKSGFLDKGNHISFILEFTLV